MDLTTYRCPESRFAFHMTARDNVASIREDGLQRSARNNADTELVSEALISRGYDDPFPFDRTEVIYCHLDASIVEELYKISNEFANDPVIAVVDLDAVSVPLYLADMGIASEFIDHHVASAAATATNTFDEAVQEYRESIVRLDGIDSVPEQIDVFDGHPELVVDGDIPAKAIVEIDKF